LLSAIIIKNWLTAEFDIQKWLSASWLTGRPASQPILKL